MIILNINDIEENLYSTVLKFADDIKVMKVIQSVIDNHHCHADLQNDIKGLEKLGQIMANAVQCGQMQDDEFWI